MRRLLLDLDPYGGTDPLGLFPLFLKRTVDVMAPRLSVVFRRLVRMGSFPACWRQANVTPIPKGQFITKLTLGLRVGFISSHLAADKLFPVNPRAITGPPKISLLLEAKACLN